MQFGFGNHFETEAVPGALPAGRNSPQKVPFGLYAEQLSGTAFTAPRHENRRSWLYRLRPAASHPPFAPIERAPLWLTPPIAGAPSPNRLRWDPLPLPDTPTDFIDGQVTYAAAGDPSLGIGMAAGMWATNRSMDGAFVNADADMLIVPQHGGLRVVTELGQLGLDPLQILLIPRGLRIRVELTTDSARGYLCENFGAPFQLPELGPIGANGLASPRDFTAPVAAFEDSDRSIEIVQKFCGSFWATTIDHSPFDVVAWHGNLAPFRYDLTRFNVLGSVSFDHPDPSIFTVLTSPSDSPGTANCDFVIFPPRWQVADETFRPPWFHRNVMSEFMGLIAGEYDAKAGGFVPGGASLHNRMAAHGPDRATYEGAIACELKPVRIDETMAFMFETQFVLHTTEWAMNGGTRQSDYDDCWSGFSKAVLP